MLSATQQKIKNIFLPALLFTVAVIGVLFMLNFINTKSNTFSKPGAANAGNNKCNSTNISCKDGVSDDAQGNSSLLLKLQHFIE